jgi:hypothetical protein
MHIISETRFGQCRLVNVYGSARQKICFQGACTTSIGASNAVELCAASFGRNFAQIFGKGIERCIV